MNAVGVTGQLWELSRSSDEYKASRIEDCPTLLSDGYARFLNRYYTSVGYRPESKIPINLVITDDYRIYQLSKKEYIDSLAPIRFKQVVEIVRTQSIMWMNYYDKITKWYGLSTNNELYLCDNIGLLSRSTLLIRTNNQWWTTVNCNGCYNLNHRLVIGDLSTGQFLEQRENVIHTDEGYWLFKINNSDVISTRIKIELIDGLVIGAVSASSNGRSGANILTEDGEIIYD